MATKARDAFRTISEVADWLDVPAHVLRFWESKFSQIKPVKRAGGRRYYRPLDMELIGGIKKLLHDDGMTIRGVQKMLKEDGVKAVSALSQSLDSVEEAASPRTARRKVETPEVEDTVTETAPEVIEDAVLAEEQEAVDAWEADAKDEASVPERAPLEIATLPETAETQDEANDAETEPLENQLQDDDVPEAPYIDVEEETQVGGDNVVELTSRAETEPEIINEVEPETEVAQKVSTEPESAEVPEPELAAAPETETETEMDAAAELEVQADPEPKHAETAPESPAPEPTEAPTETPEPTQEGFQLSDAQLAAQALRRKLRSTEASTLRADGLAPHVARLKVLRDRLASELGQ